LLLDGRGAVAVIAASAALAATGQLSDLFLTELLGETAIGEALVRAKRRSRRRDVALTMNLLGDPMSVFAPPPLAIELEFSSGGGADRSLRGRVDDGVAGGRLRIEWLDASGLELASVERELATNHFEAAWPELSRRVRFVRAYAWNERTQRDARGARHVD
jgi:hypothetical protein